MSPIAPFRRRTIDQLKIDDERSMRAVPLYARLKRLLLRDRYAFRVLRSGSEKKRAAPADWNRALLLNLTFWSPADPADVLVEERIPADVIAHVAWHHLASRALGPLAGCAEGLLFAEAIASAFDLYLVGRLLVTAPGSIFLKTQVPAMAEIAQSAGQSARDFEALLSAIAGDPEAAFSDLRALLFDTASKLIRARGTDEAARVLSQQARHRFHSLLHHYNLSNWVLYARAHAPASPAAAESTMRELDRALRGPNGALAWLERNWLCVVEDEGR